MTDTSRPARYFFDTLDERGSHEDDEGAILPTMEDARRHALRALPDMVRDSVPDAGDHLEFAVQVRDESGATIFLARLVLDAGWAVDAP